MKSFIVQAPSQMAASFISLLAFLCAATAKVTTDQTNKLFFAITTLANKLHRL
jgi:hypothetical protein